MKILALSLYNVIIKHKSYIKVLLNYLFIFIILFSIILYAFMINNSHNKSINNNSSLNRIFINQPLSETEKQEIRHMDNIVDIISKKIFVPETDQDFFIVVDDNEYRIDHQSYKSIDMIDFTSSTFSPNYHVEFTNRYSKSIFKYGRDIRKNDEIILSECIFDYINVFNIEKLINKKIIIKYSDEVIVERKLVGIIDKKIKELSLFNGSLIFIKQDISKYNDLVTEISLKDFSKTKNTLNDLNKSYDCIFFGTSVIESISMIMGQKSFLNNFLSMLCIIVCVVFLLNIIQNQYFLFKKNTAYYGILKTQGMSKLKIFNLIFYELLIICFISMILSFTIASSIILILQKSISMMLGLEILMPTIKQIIILLLFAFLMTILFSLLITIIIYFSFIKKSPVNLLKKIG